MRKGRKNRETREVLKRRVKEEPVSCEKKSNLRGNAREILRERKKEQ